MMSYRSASLLDPLRRLRRRIVQLRYYSRLFRALDAFRLLAEDRGSREFTIYSKELRRPITLRRSTSDLSVILKILGERDYHIHQHISPRLIIDAGANIGVSTLYFATKYPDACIYAIEPESSNFELLKTNCAGVSNVIPVCAAIWPRATKLSVVDRHSPKWSFAFKEDESGGDIQTITIADILRETRLEVIDLLKLDVEGAEKELFSAGCMEWLSRVRMIIVELHDRFVPGCSQAFYSKLCTMKFNQEIRGENIIIHLQPGGVMA